MAAVVLGNALEFYDFIAYSFFAKTDRRGLFPLDGAECQPALLAAGVLGRLLHPPIGAAVIGAYADRAGRKAAMLVTIVLMAVGMLILAATPGFATIGWAAPALVILGRLIQGFALGGEVGPSTSYLLEAAPAARRAFSPAGSSPARAWRKCWPALSASCWRSR